MTDTLTAVAVSLLSAVAYALAAVAQERLASRAPRPGLAPLLRSGPWWASTGLNAGGALLHVVALDHGPLSVVQPLGALTLVVAVPLGAKAAGRRVSGAEWRGTALTLAGLAALLVSASGPAPVRGLSPVAAIGVAGCAAALMGVLARPGTRPGLRHATAAGVSSGVASALTQTLTVAATGPGGPGLGPQTVMVAVLVAAFAAGGLLIAQTAYRSGLGAPLAVTTLVNPVAASVIGLVLLGEHLQDGLLGVPLALAGAVAAARGVVLLTHTTAGPGRARRPGEGEPRERGRPHGQLA
ncbi:hypothetical protein [Streptomyces abyssomicinicus]|uniref:hypothetical protein n=1 Tax=Streptomyces abyssomicinicus TaxID=574929 RepID=UPI001FEA8883|nr:hypothetical protein [Streptomyces abyssomicinicus]